METLPRHQALGDELRQLEEEIEHLEDKLEKQNCIIDSLDKDQIESYISKFTSLPPGDECDALVQSIDKLESELKLIQTITGIVIDDTTSTVINEDGQQGQKKQFTVGGSAYDLEFSLQFVVEESEESGEEPAAARIRQLDISIEEEIPESIIKGLERVEESCCIQDFFRIIVPYGKWEQARRKTFNHFAKKYSKLVQLHEDRTDVMQIYSEAKPGVILTVNWSLLLSEKNTVIPLIQLYVQASNKVVEDDANEFLKTAPDKFQQMIASYGVEKALEILIQAVSGPDEDSD